MDAPPAAAVDSGAPAAPVRRALPADAPALAELAADTFPLACPPDALPESIAAFIAENLSLARFEEYLADPTRALFVAERDGRAVGYTMLIVAEPTDPDVAAVVTERPTAELSKVYVRPESHGGAIAAGLVAVTLEEARDRGAHSVWLGVNQQNARAQRFYAKCGFERVGTKHFRVGARLEDDFVLAREL